MTPAATPLPPPAPEKHHWLRQLGDELFFVFMIVMFFKLFLVDLYKIPTGSMTPTLIGGLIARLDMNGDGRKDLAYWLDERSDLGTLRYYAREDGHLIAPVPPRANAGRMDDPRFAPPEEANNWRRMRLAHTRYDRILVNKLSYWFRDPRRGEIVVFKVPPVIWRAEAPIYIKRMAGAPGETLTFDPRGRLAVNGQVVEQPAFYQTQWYSTRINVAAAGFGELPEARYGPLNDSGHEVELRRIDVPPGQAYVFGDNSLGSLDSRYWGGVPLDHFKGRAFFRVWPLPVAGWLK